MTGAPARAVALRQRVLGAQAVPVVLAALPIVVAVGRALRRGWIPMGDNAYFSIRARDVLTEHHPLLGAWSSGSDAVGIDVNNLGPLQLDLLAPFVRLLGFGPGTAIGVAAVNVAAVAMVVLFARRRLGTLGAWLGAAMATAVAWTLGSELLFEPRQHHALVLPFLAFLTGVWSLARGDRKALPWTALVASLLAQTHLTFAIPTLALSVVALVAAAGAEVRAAGRSGAWRAWRWSVLTTAAVLAACWAQPVVEELQAGQGNLSAVREASGADVPTYGLAAAARAVATVVGPPSGWWRSSFRSFDPAGGLLAPAAATAVLVAGVGVLGGLAWVVARRRDDVTAAWLATALVALAVGTLAAASSRLAEPFGAVSGNFRFLWPMAAFATFAVLGAAIRLAGERVRDAATTGLAVLTIVLVVAAVPTSYQSPQPEDDAPLIPVATSLRDQVLEADLTGPVAVDRGGLFFGEPYSYVVLAALQESGLDLVLDAPTDLARFGDERRRDGPVAGTITFAFGPDALEDRPGDVLVARAAHDDPPGAATVAVWFEPND